MSDRTFNIISLIIIVIGLAFVAWELKQNREMIMVQLASDGAIGRSEMWMQIGSEYSVEFSKACRNEDLSVEEVFKLENMFLAVKEQLVDRFRNYEKWGDFGVPWEENAKSYFDVLFTTNFGRRRWEIYRDNVPEEMRRIGDEYLSSLGPVDCGFKPFGG